MAGASTLVLSFVAVLAAPDAAAGQLVRGMVFDETSREPLPGSLVQILEPDLTPVATTQADSRGAYSVALPTAGRYVLVASRAGYANNPPEVVDVAEHETINLLLNLRSLRPERFDYTVSQAEVEGRKGYVFGQVLQYINGDPIENAEVSLSNRSTSTLTNQAGRFRFDDVEPGPTVLRVGHLSYALQEYLVDVEHGLAYQFTVRMDVDPIEVEGIEVVARSRFVARRLEPVYARMDRKAFGYFSSTPDFERRGHPPVAAMLRDMPSTRVQNRGLFWSVQLRGGCTPTIWLDGRRVGAGASEFLNMSTIDVDVIEVFPGPASLPPEYNDAGTFCAVGIWTKRGG